MTETVADHRAARGQSFLLGAFSFALFLSASAMFMLQPMVGKMLLPLVGGAPAGWITAMAFFQLMLLLGYLLAHFLTRLSPQKHTAVFILALLLGCVFLPIHLSPNIDASDMSPWGVFRILLAHAALPFIALSASASTLQRLFLNTSHPSAADPYFLYAASNLGSFAGLLSYPFLVEPLATLSSQTFIWAGGYAALILLAGFCLLLARQNPVARKSMAASATTDTAPPSWRARCKWMALSFLPSGLMLAVTTHVTTDLVAAPLLWVLPLGLYLLTFVAAFSKWEFLPAGLILRVQPTVAALAVLLALLMDGALPPLWGMICHLFAFTIVALMCHQQLAAARPADDDGKRLTEFYLLIATGGALGGVLNAFIIPAMANTLIEYPLFMIASCFLNPGIQNKYRPRKWPLIISLLLALILFIATLLPGGDQTKALLWIIFLTGIFLLSSLHPRAMVVMCTILFLGSRFYFTAADNLLTARNFFGVIRIDDRAGYWEDTKYLIRNFAHGTTLHGYQILEPAELKTEPTSYFSRKGPVGDIFETFQPKDVAVIGLGAGTLACHNARDRAYTFIEIDPAVVDVAKEYFTFLNDCPGREAPVLITGDGRIELQKLPDEQFDLIVMDAFSSDAVPVHLISIEALQLYMQKLKEGGVIAINISNRYLDLQPVLDAAAKRIGFYGIARTDTYMRIPVSQSSKWYVMTASPRALDTLRNKGWSTTEPVDNIRYYTDDYANILRLLKF